MAKNRDIDLERSAYAESMTAHANDLRDEGIYKEMASVLCGAGCFDVEHPVHVDCGCGPGDLLIALANSLRGKSGRCDLIGVDTNSVLIAEVRRKAEAIGIPTIVHDRTQLKQGVTKATRGKFDRRYLEDAEALGQIAKRREGLNLILVADDLREGSVFRAVSKKIGSDISSMSYTFPGISGDMILEGAVDLPDEEIAPRANNLRLELTSAIRKLAQSGLRPGGYFFQAERVPSSNKLSEIANAFLTLMKNYGSFDLKDSRTIFGDLVPLLERSSLKFTAKISLGQPETLRLDSFLFEKTD